jgi:transposase
MNASRKSGVAGTIPFNNAAERALRGLALGRKSWLFAGSERGAERAALMYTLIQTAKLNNVDPQAWLADVLARIADTPQTKLAEILPWKWRPEPSRQKAAQPRPTPEGYLSISLA